jgi:drug/metabolite transporter (DMT)-like permease
VSQPVQERLGGLPAAILIVCCGAWGFNQVSVKTSLSGVSPLCGAGLRSLGAAVLLWLWCALRGEALFVRDGTGRYGLLIGLLFAVEFVCIYGGLAFTTASRSVIFLYSAPFFVALGAHWLIPGERLTVARVGGLTVAFVGLCLAFAEGLTLPSRAALVGDGIELVGGFMWGATTVAVKMGSSRPLTAQRTLFYQLTISAAVLLGLSVALGEPGLTRPTATVLVALGYQIVVVAFASYLIWFWLLQRYPASGLAAFSFWTPIFGVIAGWLVLGDPLTGRLGVAAVLIALGIYLVNRRA